MSRNRNDRIKEIVVKILIVFLLFFQFGSLIVCQFVDNEETIIILLISFVVVSILILIIILSISKSIKTTKKKEKHAFIEYSVEKILNMRETFEKIGSVKQSNDRENDYYVAFTEKADLITKDIIIISHIEVDSTYTKEDYQKFVNNIPELRYSTREKVNEDFTNYEKEIFLVIFSQKDNCEFVDKYIRTSFSQWRRFLSVIIYDEKESTIKFLKKGWYNNKITIKYLKKIFRFI